MSMPKWWGERRYGLFVHSSLAAVPAWAPIGQYADCYQSHLGEDGAEIAHHAQPMVEVLAHHRDRWGHIDRFADFLPLLTFDQFDAEDWARLAVDAGMGYTVFVAKHHDGWCWWDAPNTKRTMVRGGPYRNVIADYAAACERNDIVFGTYYSLLESRDQRYSEAEYFEQVVHPHVTDLVERYGSQMLWGDSNQGRLPSNWLTGDLLEQVCKINPDLVVNDRWTNPAQGEDQTEINLVQTFEYSMPAEVLESPWELRRGVGRGFGYNRAERVEHYMSGFDIVSLLTEVVAKGGNLLLGVGARLDGTISDMQSAPLRDAGEWIRRNDALINHSTPWTQWGDDHVRYLRVEGILHAVDLSGRGHFAALDPEHCRVDNIQLVNGDEPSDNRFAPSPTFHQDDNGLHVDLPRHPGDQTNGHDSVRGISVYRLEVSEPERPVELFAPAPSEPILLEPLLNEVAPGEILQLAEGIYLGPASVPPGVILRGLGVGRTTIDGETAVQLQRNSRLEHVSVSANTRLGSTDSAVAVEVVGRSATILGCEVDGQIRVRSDDVVIRASSAGGVVADGSERLTISRCQLTGTSWDIGIHLIGGGDHEIDSCEIHDHLCAIRVVDTTGTTIRGNNISARWWGVHLQRTERAHVHGNHVDHTMRAVDVDGGTQALIDGNAVADGDSGCIVEWGASGCQVSGNCWERCRIGLLAWEATGLHEQDNLSIDLHETDHAIVFGP